MSKSIRYFFYLLLIWNTYALAQPSSSVSITFQFFEKDKPLTNIDFDKRYQILSKSRNKNRSIEYKYEEKSKTFTVGESIVYNDLILEIISLKDTMQLVFQTKGGTKHQFNIEQLEFKEGVFIINDSHLKRVDTENSNSNHYNAVLTSFLSANNSSSNSFQKRKLDNLKLKYGIDDDDLEKKSEKELIAVSTYKDSPILKKYKDYLTKRNFVDNSDSDKIEDGILTYAPDKQFKIYVYKGESCGANCHSFFNSFLHFNLDKKVPSVVETHFYSIDSIVKIDNTNYIVFHSGYDGGGIYLEEHYAATILSFDNNNIRIGKFTLSNMHQSNNNESEIRITARQSELEDGTPFGMKFNPNNKMVEYQYFINNQDTGSKRKYSGKLIYEKGVFRWLSKSG